MSNQNKYKKNLRNRSLKENMKANQGPKHPRIPFHTPKHPTIPLIPQNL